MELALDGYRLEEVEPLFLRQAVHFVQGLDFTVLVDLLGRGYAHSALLTCLALHFPNGRRVKRLPVSHSEW
jgi:hypothetical protein